MRVLQLIDSLEVGGAERVAVNLANVLASNIDASYLCATRAEGLLKAAINQKVSYLFLRKKNTFDVKAILKLHTFIKTEKIDIIHAHSSSFFLATLITFLNKHPKIVWHDHYGNSEFLHQRTFKILKMCSKRFAHIFSVNTILQIWAKQNLKTLSVSYLPNFAVKISENKLTTLHGTQGKRMVCLANLRSQKDHITLLQSFKIVLNKHEDWSLHLVGKDFNDSYSKTVKDYIVNEQLTDAVFLYGSKPDTFHILQQATIAVLSSNSEGLPLALLEYGLANLPVVTTSVGECPKLVSHNINGLLVNSKDVLQLSEAILKYIENESLRHTYATRFNAVVQKQFSQEAQLKTIIHIYKTINN